MRNFYFLSALLLIVAGIHTLITQKIPQGKYGAWVNIGSYAYIVGAIMLAVGLLALYALLKGLRD